MTTRHALFSRRIAVAVMALCGLLPGPWPAMAQSPPLPGGPTAPARFAASVPQPARRRALLLYADPRLTPALVIVDALIRSTVEDRSHPLDLILAGASGALRITLQTRAELFSSAPVVFVSENPTAAPDLRFDADVTGTWLHQGWVGTLELARRLQPEIRAGVVTGSSPVDRVWMARARKQFTVGGPIEVAYLADLSLEDVLGKVRVLPGHTVVLVGVFFRDGTGRDFSTPEAIGRIAAAASVPVYGLTDNAVGTGVVEGHVVSFETHGNVAAELALRVLAGERPAPIDVETTVPMFDARQLIRWGLDARRLPPGSRVLFQEPSVWARYRYIFSAVGVLLVQSGLIAALLIQRAQRRRAQESLAERLRFETLLADLSGILAASSPAEADPQVQSALRRMGESLGVDWATVRAMEPRATELWLTHAWTRADLPPRPTVIREDEAPWIFARLRQGRIVRLAGPGTLPDEAPVDRHTLAALGAWSLVLVPLVRDGAVVGCLAVGTIREERRWPDESVSRLQLLAEAFATALERQRAARAARESEDQIRDLARRLMTAQEEERRRIARDLHDDVNQELAAQSIALSALGDRIADVTTPAVREEVARLQARTVDLAKAIRHLSHSLHPGVLQHAGLVAALRGYCRGFEREHHLPVTFRAEGELGTVPSDVALCLYRVTQEGLGNVARHAAAQHARVTVGRERHDVVLTIGDDGRGFDLAEARRRHGLGLISLDERVRLAGGRLTIDSQSQRGTELRVVVPLSEARDAPRDRAAG